MKKRNRLFLLLTLLLFSCYSLTACSQSEETSEETVEEEPFYYDITKFIEEDGLMTFQDTHYTYTTGIDVSNFQHEIDWESVASDGIEFAMIRIGYRGAVEGLLHEDANFRVNVEGAIENNIDVGLYWYSSALNEEELQEEIDYILELVSQYDIKYPIGFDMEPYEDDENGGRISTLTTEEKTNLALYFCKTMQSYGYQTLIYGNYDWLYGNLDFSEVADEDIWYAAYQSKPAIKDRFVMWQYSNAGTVSGIDTYVDINIYIEEK